MNDSLTILQVAGLVLACLVGGAALLTLLLGRLARPATRARGRGKGVAWLADPYCWVPWS